MTKRRLVGVALDQERTMQHAHNTPRRIAAMSVKFASDGLTICLVGNARAIGNGQVCGGQIDNEWTVDGCLENGSATDPLASVVAGLLTWTFA
jgi:hypothetical protein